MDFLLTLLYVAGTYLRPAEVFPILAPYRVMLVLGIVAVAAGLVTTARGHGPTLRAPQVYLVPAFALWAVFTVMAQGWLGGAVPAAEELSATVLLFLAVTLAVTSLARVRLLAAVLAVLTVAVVTQGVAALHWGYKRSVFVLQDGIERDWGKSQEWTPQAERAEAADDAEEPDADGAPATPAMDAATADEGAAPVVLRIRSRGVLHDPNDLGQAIVAALPLLLAFWRRDRPARNLLLVAPVALFLLYGVYLTRSRGAMISLVVVLALAGGERLGGVAALVAGLGGLGLLAAIGFAGRAVALDASATGRTESWANGLQMLWSSPVWGVGYGNYLEYNDLVAHNSFVHCFAELGLVGYFVWLAILAITWWQIGAVARAARAADPELARWASAARLSLTGFVAAAFFLSRTYGAMLFLILALATAVVDLGRREGRLAGRFPLGAWLAGIASLEATSVVFFALVVRLSRLAQ